MSYAGPSKRVILTLKEFMLRQEVLKLYRSFFRTIKQLPDPVHRKEVADWIRADFKTYSKSSSLKDEDHVKSLLFQGTKSLNELKQSVDLSKA
jgi:hypothetical protein